MFKRSTSPRRTAKRRRLAAEPLEARRVLAASLGWDGPGLGSAELTYTISNAPSSLSQSEVNAAIKTALDAWASVADITFTQVSQTGLRDSIDISFTNIDGAGRTLAQAYFPDDVNPARIAGDIQFDLAEVWEVGNSLGNRAFDLVWVAVHEIGHSLGLDHINQAGSVLQAFVSPNQFFTGLSASDVAEIQSLYAAADGTVTPQTPVVDTPVNGNVDPTDTGDTDNDPFPPRRWRRGGPWWRWGGRLDADVPDNHNLYIPTDTNNDGSTSALDALVIINQLTQTTPSATGMCDVNGDGNVTALDALMVINSLSESVATTNASAPVTQPDESVEDEVVDDEDGTIIEDDEEMVDTTDSMESEVDDGSVSEDDSSDTDAETTDPVDQTDDTSDGAMDPVGEADENGVDDTPNEPMDDGGLIDEEGDCDSRRSGHMGRFGFGRFRFVGAWGEQLFARFDSNEDGGLTEDEVPESIWQRLVDKSIDTDTDGSITLAEFQAYAESQRAERFAERDDNGDGLLTEDEVSSWLWQKISPADSSGDGGVSLEEFESWLEQRTTETPETTDPVPVLRGFDGAFAQLGRRSGRSRR